MTLDSFMDSVKNDPHFYERFNLYSRRIGKYNGYFGHRHPPEIIEIIRKASTGRPKTAEELAKLSAASSGPNKVSMMNITLMSQSAK